MSKTSQGAYERGERYDLSLTRCEVSLGYIRSVQGTRTKTQMQNVMLLHDSKNRLLLLSTTRRPAHLVVCESSLNVRGEVRPVAELFFSNDEIA